ncbi:AMP-binding protein [Pararhodobacter zhoushanensis]|uniref:AMP-binding protein n=1 Tax=Pararhodobacter zhoushanensis TaxID=2479545 RepID=A0ABT3H1B5_9RHOB|nr:AMP-binding protein [Pararhodobacter zhoushanensis]MCW1933577.1 AMP-binding protein [Pararhodobacter zhoushanensis]
MGYPWNFGDLLDATAAQVPPDRPAIVQGDRVIAWPAFDQATNRLARAMIAAGLEPGARVAILARNVPEYIEISAASFKARMASVNVNYRYTTPEIAHLMSDSQAAMLLYQPEFAAVVAPLADSHPDLQLVAIDAGGRYGDWVSQGDGAPLGIARSGDDGYLIYTGGTTGKPKGVVWRAADARTTQLESPAASSVPQSLDDHIAAVRANTAPHRVLPACPLMHGAGMTSSLAELVNGGTVVLLPDGPFDAGVLLDTVQQHRVTRILIVGDVFARPMVEALQREPGRWDTSPLRIISSAGLMWSREMKQALVAAIPQVVLVDILGASEASGLGYAVTSATRETPTGWFEPGPRTVLIDPETLRVLGPDEPGTGWIARHGAVGSGYFGDPEKTAATYREIDGLRYAIPGDLAARDTDGRLRLIGRGSQVINTGGEKVFAEEVEEALKRAPGVTDAIVIGIPDETWGKAVVAVIAVREGYDEAAARLALQADLARYKLPKRIVVVDTLPRHPSGKSDYRAALDIVLGGAA